MGSKMFNCRRLLFLMLVLFTILSFYLILRGKDHPIKLVMVFDEDQVILIRLKEISDVDMKPYVGEKLIFFLETSRRIRPGGVIDPKARQLCAVESAAKNNPDSTIFFLYLSPDNLVNESLYLNKTDDLQRQLLQYRNIKVRKICLNRYMMDTPLHKWYLNGTLKTSHFPTEHTSDILRYMTLWKFGGTYLDLDFVVLKSLDSAGVNYVVAESPWFTSNAVLNFQPTGIGHTFAEDCLKEVRDDYRGKEWSYNGPLLIKRIMERYCHTKEISKMNVTSCRGMNLYMPYLFYGVHWDLTDTFFNPQNLSLVLKLVEPSYAVHLWNQYTARKFVNTSIENVPYGVLAQMHCPYVYSNTGPKF